ncbi:MAG: OmpA family protein [Caulobacteraceae bacterium]|nr:OmpA family protein [Caulobacter sp.]
MSKPLLAAAGALALMGAAGAAHAQPDRWDWRGPEVGRPFDLVGPGMRFLVPELRDNPRGHAFVLRNFDFNHDGLVEVGEARAANRAFAEAAGPDRGGFDWDRRWRDPADAAPPPPPPPAATGWDRPAMRAYHFRQNQYGAVFSIGDVLFETGSARLRPTALDKLRPLAGYLRANPGQRLRIDGYTDSVGTAQANLILSRDRARSVADALSAVGVDAARFQLEGHGEDSPTASNGTAAGRQLNRRVEVTLVGRRAADFE